MLTRLSLFLILFICFFYQINTIYGDSKISAAIVIDGRNGKVLYSKNADTPRHPASLTKKMTLYLIFEALREKKITLNTVYNVSQQAAQTAPCKLGISAGKTVTIDTIIKGLVTKSANDMAVLVAEKLGQGSVSKFVERMNIKARELGMKSTHFTNSTGLPDFGRSRKRGSQRQTTTARDMAILSQALYNDFPEYWKYFKIKTFNYLGSTHHNHNHLMKTFAGMEGVKTGWVNASGFNLSTSAVRYTAAGNPVRLFAVVLGGKTRHIRDRHMADMLETHFKKLGAIKLEDEKTTSALVSTRKGSLDEYLNQ